MTANQVLLTTAPSRHDNPFATCWTRPGAIEFHFGDGLSARTLVKKLASQRWQGAIIGPHGCGKSTLLETLKQALRASGLEIHSITLQNAQRKLPSEFLPSIVPQARPGISMAIVDGYEQLGWLERMQLASRCRGANCGLLVTAHRPTHLPLLIQLAPDEPLVQRLVAELASQVSTQVTPADVAASFARRGSNVREMLFDLYDRHEALRRSRRDSVDAAARFSRP
jgi:energy-coupling factor transporter ATP-binding protein EcfA2